ncbi:MAG: hypothetical protein CL394_09955 [Acidiferrobacteraceae bacterium]|nr:hypothetical protein [Acidiferrobacteraceae bacterium]
MPGAATVRRAFTATSLPEARLVQQMLQMAGIEAFVFNANAVGALGELPATEIWPEVWIGRDHQQNAARMLIERYESVAEETTDCPKCNEPNPATFEICWCCRRPLAVTL